MLPYTYLTNADKKCLYIRTQCHKLERQMLHSTEIKHSNWLFQVPQLVFNQLEFFISVYYSNARQSEEVRSSPDDII